MTNKCFLDFNRSCDKRCKAYDGQYSDPYDCQVLHEVSKSNQTLGGIERQLRAIERQLRN